MTARKINRKGRGAGRALRLLAAALLVLAAAFALYCAVYYHADGTALDALVSDEAVSIERRDYGWFFDGPGEDAALIFYPGAKVEETAYAPLLRQLAERGVDVCLVRMPLRLAVFGADRAGAVMAEHDCARWYIGGHSLGGAVAANYASSHPGGLEGLVLLAAYPTHPLDGALVEISLYGSEDGVLDRARLEAGRQYAPARSEELVIKGGNHAQFGSYGSQRGDGEASIPPAAQWAQAADFIAGFIAPEFVLAPAA